MTTASPEKQSTVVGKDELIHQVAAKAGLNLKETSKVIDAFTEVVCEDVAQGHEVRLMGFGTWNLRLFLLENVLASPSVPYFHRPPSQKSSHPGQPNLHIPQTKVVRTV